jgi:hypothetical protein
MRRIKYIYFRTIQSFDFYLFYVPIKNAHHIEKYRTLGVPTPHKHVWHMRISWFFFVFQISCTETRNLNKYHPNLIYQGTTNENPTFNMHHTCWVVFTQNFFLVPCLKDQNDQWKKMEHIPKIDHLNFGHVHGHNHKKMTCRTSNYFLIIHQ